MSHLSDADQVITVIDEYDLIVGKLPIKGKRVIELGCGDGRMAQRLAEQAHAQQVLALEVDETQLARLQQSGQDPAYPQNLRYEYGQAQEIEAPDSSFDCALMLKSLHHVPIQSMDSALLEIRRVLCPQGVLYVSEPVFDGPLNEVMRLFHDEQRVRAEAISAIERTCKNGVFSRIEQVNFMTPVMFADFSDFERRMMNLTHTALRITPQIHEEVRRRFETHAAYNTTDQGVHFMRPMRVDLLACV